MSGAVIDVELGIERSFGAADLWRRAVAALMAELPCALIDMEHAFADNRLGDLKLRAHQLYGMAIFCGTPALDEAIKALELACVNAPDRMENHLERLRVEVARLNAFVDKYGIPEI